MKKLFLVVYRDFIFSHLIENKTLWTVLLALSMFLCPAVFSYAYARVRTHRTNLPIHMDFRVNRTVIEPDYMNNSSKFQLLDSIFMHTSYDAIDSIVICSYASPEGYYHSNIALAKGREKAFNDFIAKHYPDFPTSKIIIRGGVESWEQLIDTLRVDPNISPEAAQKIIEVASSDIYHVRKKEMMRAFPEYGYIKDNLYPYLRYTSVQGFFTKVIDDDPVPAVGTPVPQTGAQTLPENRSGLAPRTVFPEEQEEVELPLEEPVSHERRHLIALRSNLLYDVFYMPRFGFAPMWDIQAEYYPLGGHWTCNLQFTSPYWHKWDEHKFFQIRDYRAEARRYFRGGGQFTGFYASAYAHATRFGIGLSDDDGWQGEGAGAGLQGGYVMPLNRKGNLRLEFNVGAGFFMALYDPYTYGNPVTGTKDGQYYYNFLGSADKFKPRNHRFTWFGPTAAGVSLTYDIIYRKRKEARK